MSADDDAETRLAPRRRPALLAGGAAVAGAAIATVVGPGVGGIVIALILALVVLGCGALLARIAGNTPVPGQSGASARDVAFSNRRGLLFRATVPWLVALGIAFVFVAWGGARALPAPDSLAVHFPEGAELVRLEGVIVEGADYVRRDPAAFEYPDAPEPQAGFPIGADPRRSISYLLRAERLPDLDQPASGYVKIYAIEGTDLRPGMKVSVIGRLRLPRRAGNPGEVDSLKIYQRRGITHTMSIGNPGLITVLAEPSPLSPHSLAYNVHVAFHDLVGSRMSRERAAVLGATLLGERGNLSIDQRQKFVRSGTVHLLVVSGLHVGLLAGAIVLLLRVFGVDPRHAWAVGALVALAYLFVTGIQPSVLRATTMVCVYALGRVLLRKPDALNVLGASALISLLINPTDVAELGFQLSYLSVAGIFVLAPMLKLRPPLTPSERAVQGLRGKSLAWIGGSVRVSLAVGLCTWPLLVATVHVFSPIMVAANIVAAPLLSVLLVLGLLTPLAVIPGVGAVLAWLLSLTAGVLDGLAGFFASVPYGHLFLPASPAWWLIGYYVLLASVLLLPRIGWPRVSGAALWLAWLCVLPASSLLATDGPGPVRMTALDVGHGQCVVIEVPDGPTALLDCGSTSLGNVGERVLAPYLWQRRRSKIDILFISHADADHVNGLPQLFERFPVGVVYVPATFADDDTGVALQAWLERRAEVRVLERGEGIELAPGLIIRCLWPDVDFVRSLISPGLQRNEGGLVLELQAGPTRVLLPSDTETPGLAGVLPLVESSDILFAPHQGSRVTGLPEILEHLQPRHVLVSSRELFPAEESMDAYEASGAEVWMTYEHGAVSFLLGADGGVEVRPHIRR